MPAASSSTPAATDPGGLPDLWASPVFWAGVATCAAGLFGILWGVTLLACRRAQATAQAARTQVEVLGLRLAESEQQRTAALAEQARLAAALQQTEARLLVDRGALEQARADHRAVYVELTQLARDVEQVERENALLQQELRCRADERARPSAGGDAIPPTDDLLADSGFGSRGGSRPPAATGETTPPPAAQASTAAPGTQPPPKDALRLESTREQGEGSGGAREEERGRQPTRRRSGGKEGGAPPVGARGGIRHKREAAAPAPQPSTTSSVETPGDAG